MLQPLVQAPATVYLVSFAVMPSTWLRDRAPTSFCWSGHLLCSLPLHEQLLAEPVSKEKRREPHTIAETEYLCLQPLQLVEDVSRCIFSRPDVFHLYIWLVAHGVRMETSILMSRACPPE